MSVKPDCQFSPPVITPATFPVPPVIVPQLPPLNAPNIPDVAPPDIPVPAGGGGLGCGSLSLFLKRDYTAYPRTETGNTNWTKYVDKQKQNCVNVSTDEALLEDPGAWDVGNADGIASNFSGPGGCDPEKKPLLYLRNYTAYPPTNAGDSAWEAWVGTQDQKPPPDGECQCQHLKEWIDRDTVAYPLTPAGNTAFAQFAEDQVTGCMAGFERRRNLDPNDISELLDGFAALLADPSFFANVMDAGINGVASGGDLGVLTDWANFGLTGLTVGQMQNFNNIFRDLCLGYLELATIKVDSIQFPCLSDKAWIDKNGVMFYPDTGPAIKILTSDLGKAKEDVKLREMGLVDPTDLKIKSCQVACSEGFNTLGSIDHPFKIVDKTDYSSGSVTSWQFQMSRGAVFFSPHYGSMQTFALQGYNFGDSAPRIIYLYESNVGLYDSTLVIKCEKVPPPSWTNYPNPDFLDISNTRYRGVKILGYITMYSNHSADIRQYVKANLLRKMTLVNNIPTSMFDPDVADFVYGT